MTTLKVISMSLEYNDWKGPEEQVSKVNKD